MRANPHKETVSHSNGFVTFKNLSVGEELRLPEKWFGPRMDLLPPAYYGCLPYADGVTPSPFGELAPAVLRDFFALDEVDELLQAGEREAAGALIVETMRRLVETPSDVYKTHAAEALAHASNGRLESALLAAQHALRDEYATLQPPGHS